MMRRWLAGVLVLVALTGGCCWRPAWCQNQGYAQPVYAPQPTYQPQAYAPQQYQQYAPVSSPCTCY